MKVWLLDGGSIVIEHTQLMWNVARPAGADPGVQRADRARRRALPDRHRHRPRPHEPGPAVRAAGADRGADDPGPARARRLRARRRDDGRQLAPAHRPRRRQPALQGHRRRARAAREGAGPGARTTSRSSSSATPTSRGTTKGRSSRRSPATSSWPRACGCTSRRVTRSAITPCSSRPKGRSRCSSPWTSPTRPAALEKGIQPGFHNDPVAGVRSIARVKALAEEHGADVFFSHDAEAWQGYKHAPDFYEL